MTDKDREKLQGFVNKIAKAGEVVKDDIATYQKDSSELKSLIREFHEECYKLREFMDKDFCDGVVAGIQEANTKRAAEYWCECISPYFSYDHLPERLAYISLQFSHLANLMIAELPYSREKVKCLDRLLEAKDCAVRAAKGV